MMRRLGQILLLSCTLLCLPLAGAAELLSHAAWDALLRQYVNDAHRVDYARWKADGTEALDAYLKGLAKPFPAGTTAAQRQAALTNAYNALTIRWVLTHFPVQSIWKTKQPFTGRRHTVDGKTVSLDDVETELRNTMGERTHAVLVCAARSCPPLRREAYTAERLDDQLDDNTRAWLARPALNEFLPAQNRAEVSKIFDWYKGDFEKNGRSLAGFLAQYAPAGRGDFLRSGKSPRITFKDYDWGLNDAGTVGANYRGFSLDYLRNK
jgi:hypothetical protein